MYTPTVVTTTTPKQNTPFRRVIEETVYVDPRLQDNSFDAKVSATTQNQLHISVMVYT